MTHLTREELERWWAQGDGDRDHIVGHLAMCDECVSRYRHVVDPPPLQAAASASAASLVRSGYRAYRDRQSRLLRPFLGRPFQAAAGLAAALVLVAVLVPGWWRAAPEVPDDAGIRGARVQLIVPNGSVSPPVEFRWTSPVAAATFRVEIYRTDSAAGEPLFTLTSTEERLTFPEALREQLEPGVRYFWRVTAFNAQGRAVSESRLRSFVVSGSEP